MKSNSKAKTLINNDIRFPKVRCIGQDGFQYGVIDTSTALSKARSLGLDLVLVAPNGNPPVCKIIDFGKYKYQQEKKKKEAKKKQKITLIKEIKLSINIAQNDLDYKIRQAKKFLQEDKHVKFRLFLRGRERSNPRMGFESLERVRKEIDDVAIVENQPSLEGRFINMISIPKKSKS